MSIRTVIFTLLLSLFVVPAAAFYLALIGA